MSVIQAKIFSATKANTFSTSRRLRNLTVAMEIVSKVASIEMMFGSRFVPVGAFGQKKNGYKKAVHGSSYPEGFTIFLERKNVLFTGSVTYLSPAKLFHSFLPF
ncbi:hypothetical protein CEXT_789771 [Caerostris extrusa]|uniref:Ribosomal protein L16 n=1 Tax=Caerostris extrusa TaxID=172846 RepID=A0AAV4YDF1_CAEEX|nr:hypothetical protein CEXT_789771 [Caerostris extrusa]